MFIAPLQIERDGWRITCTATGDGSVTIVLERGLLRFARELPLDDVERLAEWLGAAARGEAARRGDGIVPEVPSESVRR